MECSARLIAHSGAVSRFRQASIVFRIASLDAQDTYALGWTFAPGRATDDNDSREEDLFVLGVCKLLIEYDPLGTGLHRYAAYSAALGVLEPPARLSRRLPLGKDVGKLEPALLDEALTLLA